MNWDLGWCVVFGETPLSGGKGKRSEFKLTSGCHGTMGMRRWARNGGLGRRRR